MILKTTELASNPGKRKAYPCNHEEFDPFRKFFLLPTLNLTDFPLEGASWLRQDRGVLQK